MNKKQDLSVLLDFILDKDVWNQAAEITFGDSDARLRVIPFRRKRRITYQAYGLDKNKHPNNVRMFIFGDP